MKHRKSKWSLMIVISLFAIGTSVGLNACGSKTAATPKGAISLTLKKAGT